MVEFSTYVAMDGPEFLFKRANGIVQMGAVVDSWRQPGVVGMYGRKPVFIWVNEQEMNLLLSGDLEGLFKLRGYANTIMSNDSPPLPKITIP